MTRAETMAEYGVTECPDWCTQQEDEPGREAHLGGWEQAVDNGGVNGDVTVEVRPERDWWTEGDEADCLGYVRITVSGAGAAAELYGATADMVLTGDDAVRFAQVVDEARQQAEQVTGWVWAYDGAETDQAAREAADGQV